MTLIAIGPFKPRANWIDKLLSNRLCLFPSIIHFLTSAMTAAWCLCGSGSRLRAQQSRSDNREKTKKCWAENVERHNNVTNNVTVLLKWPRRSPLGLNWVELKTARAINTLSLNYSRLPRPDSFPGQIKRRTAGERSWKVVGQCENHRRRNCWYCCSNYKQKIQQESGNKSVFLSE